MTDMEYSRKERSISSWISMGSMKPSTADPPPPSPPDLPLLSGPDAAVSGAMVSWSSAASDVEEAHVLGVLLDEVTPQLDVVAHEHRAHVVGQSGLLHVDL